MLHSAGTMCGFIVVTTDGDNIGPVHELLLDEGWNVRYLFVDTGDWLAGRSVLLSTAAIQSVDSVNQRLTIALTREEVLRSPWVERRILDRKPLVGSEAAFQDGEPPYRPSTSDISARPRRAPRLSTRMAAASAGK